MYLTYGYELYVFLLVWDHTRATVRSTQNALALYALQYRSAF